MTSVVSGSPARPPLRRTNNFRITRSMSSSESASPQSSEIQSSPIPDAKAVAAAAADTHSSAGHSESAAQFASSKTSSPGLFGTASLVAMGALGPPPRGPLPNRLLKKSMPRWSVDDVSTWLRAVGLGAYVASFRRSKVNGESLARLTLKQIRDVLSIMDPFHQRSFQAGQLALKERDRASSSATDKSTGQSTPPAAVHRAIWSLWSCDEVASWFESHETMGVRPVLAANAVHGALLGQLTERDLRAMGLTNPLLVWKMTLLIDTLLLEKQQQQQQQSHTQSSSAPSLKDVDEETTRARLHLPCAQWKSQQVADWLRSLGLGQYITQFRANGINGRALLHLTDEQLVQLTMSNPLHQRSLFVGRETLVGPRDAAHQRGRGRQPAQSPAAKLLPGALRRRPRWCRSGGTSGSAVSSKPVNQWTSAKVAKWLARNDFADRKHVFEANGVHGGLLLQLTHQDLLQHLGMENVVERQRLLRDIRRLAGNTVDSPAPSSNSSSRSSPTKRSLTGDSSGLAECALSGGADKSSALPPAASCSTTTTPENASPQKRRRKSSEKSSIRQTRSSRVASLTRAAGSTASSPDKPDKQQTTGSVYGRAPFLPDRRSPIGRISRTADSPDVDAAPSGARRDHPRIVLDQASSVAPNTPPPSADELLLHPAFAIEGSQYSRLSLIREPVGCGADAQKSRVSAPPSPLAASGHHQSNSSSRNQYDDVEDADLLTGGRDVDGERSSSSPSSSLSSSAALPPCCLSCREQEVNCTIDPCKHQVACLDCVVFLERCPSCNIEIGAVTALDF